MYVFLQPSSGKSLWTLDALLARKVVIRISDRHSRRWATVVSHAQTLIGTTPLLNIAPQLNGSTSDNQRCTYQRSCFNGEVSVDRLTKDAGACITVSYLKASTKEQYPSQRDPLEKETPADVKLMFFLLPPCSFTSFNH